VTETGVMEDLTAALDVLSRLRLKGFGLSIDDFGIGYSSFEQLGRIPFTEMKLDRSFVSKGVHDAASRAILESSMDMAHKLNLSTVAEGVETAQDLKLVRSLGCDLVQGYLIARPMPVKDLIVWLGKEKTN
jgi:EAL domain-containing protein (putative c-di-GMP-specific phosphodiesterase class I)